MRFLTLLLAVLMGCEAAPDVSVEADVAAEYAAEPEEAGAVPSALPERAPVAAEPGADVVAHAAASVPDVDRAVRFLRRSADLTVRADDPEAALVAARAVAPRVDGIMSGEQGHTTGHEARTTLTLRVPSSRFDDALDALAALGHVESRSVSVDDVTGAVVDLEARVRAKRAAEARYVDLVGRAGSIGEVLQVQHSLDAVRAEIESMEARARALRGAVALATLRVTVVGPAVAAPVPDGPGVFARAVDGIAAGWHGTLSVLLGVLPLWPLALLAGGGYVVWRRVQEAPTDAAPAV